MSEVPLYASWKEGDRPGQDADHARAFAGGLGPGSTVVTYQTVKVRFWLRLSDRTLKNVFSGFLDARKRQCLVSQ